MSEETRAERRKPTSRTVDFTTIILSLRQMGLMALGLVEEESDFGVPVDPQACHLQIDMLEVLQEKTEGNLTDDENKLLQSVLYELRMAYVGHTKQKASS